MGNSWFQFKQFRIEQGSSSMKICSDSCLFAALVAEKEAAREKQPARILDPGCGTGLLGLMLAQKLPGAQITAVEKHAGSAADCRLNYAASPWSNRMQLLEGDFLSMQIPQKFDSIVCNPPFFIAHLQSPESGRNAALHIEKNELALWIGRMSDLLLPDGRIWLLLDENAGRKVVDMARMQGLQVNEQINFLRHPERIFRMVFCFVRENVANTKSGNMLVINEKGRLTGPGCSLLEDYYLNAG